MNGQRSDELALTLHQIGQLEQAYAAQIIAAAPKDGSTQSLTDYAIQTQYLRGHLAALAALRELLITPAQPEES